MKTPKGQETNRRSDAKRQEPSDRKTQRYAKQKDTWLQKTYGISLADYNAMKERQGGRCAACLEVPTGGRDLVVDHCHITGRVRELLCNTCNLGLGYFGDDPRKMERGRSYLLRHSDTHPV